MTHVMESQHVMDTNDPALTTRFLLLTLPGNTGALYLSISVIVMLYHNL